MNDCRAFDAHADTVSCIRRFGFDLLHSRGHLDLARCGEFRGYAQLFALYCRADRAPADGLWAECQRQHDIFQEQMARYPGRVRHCRTAAEVESAWEEGKTAALLSIEGAEMLECDIAKLDIAAQWGVRALNLTWNFANAVSGSNAERPEQGLSAHGRDFLRAMEERGILVDVSHLSDPGARDVLRLARRPVIASHSNARAVCPHSRNLTDGLFQGIRDTGGFVGLNVYSAFVGGSNDFAALAAHLEHFLALDGEKTVGLGGDWDGCAETPEGIEGIQSLPAFRDYLRSLGWPEDLLEDIFYRNLLRVIGGSK